MLNLGAGVQSTCLYLLAREPGSGLRFDVAIFADTGEEPRAVYDHLAWLRSLAGSNPPPDFSITKHDPRGSMAAGDMLAAWLAHDMLHLRQVAKRLYELAVVRAGGYDAAYAGPWGP